MAHRVGSFPDAAPHLQLQQLQHQQLPPLPFLRGGNNPSSSPTSQQQLLLQLQLQQQGHQIMTNGNTSSSPTASGSTLGSSPTAAMESHKRGRPTSPSSSGSPMSQQQQQQQHQFQQYQAQLYSSTGGSGGGGAGARAVVAAAAAMASAAVMRAYNNNGIMNMVNPTLNGNPTVITGGYDDSMNKRARLISSSPSPPLIVPASSLISQSSNNGSSISTQQQLLATLPPLPSLVSPTAVPALPLLPSPPSSASSSDSNNNNNNNSATTPPATVTPIPIMNAQPGGLWYRLNRESQNVLTSTSLSPDLRALVLQRPDCAWALSYVAWSHQAIHPLLRLIISDTCLASNPKCIIAMLTRAIALQKVGGNRQSEAKQQMSQAQAAAEEEYYKFLHGVIYDMDAIYDRPGGLFPPSMLLHVLLTSGQWHAAGHLSSTQVPEDHQSYALALRGMAQWQKALSVAMSSDRDWNKQEAIQLATQQVRPSVIVPLN
jgi:hypothetical protein